MQRGNTLDDLGIITTRGTSTGYTKNISRQTQQGTYLRLGPGIYTKRTTYLDAPPWERHRLTALGVGASGVRIIGGISAAVLWNMWTLVFTDIPVEYYVCRGRKEGPRQGIRLRGKLAQNDYQQGKIVKVTTRAKTILDLARTRPFEETYMAVCGVLAQGQCTIAELEELATTNTTLAIVLRHAESTVESPAEAYFLGQVRKEGRFDILPQISITDARGVLRRPDFQIRKTNILIEISGLGKYGDSDAEQRFQVEKATNRLDALVTSGYTVWAYSAKQVFSGAAYLDVLNRLERMSVITPKHGGVV